MSKWRQCCFTLHLMRLPAALESLAIDRIVAWIVNSGVRVLLPYTTIFERDPAAAEDFLSRTIETIRSHLRRNLHPRFYNSLAEALLKKIIDSRHKNGLFIVKRSCGLCDEYGAFKRTMETVFGEHLTRLTLETASLYPSFPAEAHRLSGLTDLTISLTCPDAKIEDDIIKFLKELHRLKSLSLFYSSDSCCRSNVIKCIADNCEHVETLDLSYMRYVGRASVAEMIRLQHLKKVGLFCTEVKDRDIETLLMSCGNIEVISLSPDGKDDVLATALRRIASRKENADKQFNLKYYENAHQTTQRQLELVVKMCPLLQKISLTKYTNSQSSLVKGLMDLQNLSELKLTEFDFYADGVMDLLNARGSHLTILSLDTVTEMDMNALICISNSSPILQDLCVWTCEFVSKPIRKPDSLLRSPPFGNLKKISGMSHRRAEDISEGHIEFLLAGCPSVECMEIQDLHIPEGVWLNILDKNPLIYLKEITLDAFEISELVYTRILENCVSPPDVIMHRTDYHGVKLSESEKNNLLDHFAEKFNKKCNV